MRGRGRVVSCVCLSVCLSVWSFLACSGILGLFKVSFSLALENKVAFLCLAFESDHLEAQKSLFLVTWMLVKLAF